MDESARRVAVIVHPFSVAGLSSVAGTQLAEVHVIKLRKDA
jgi:hypothetical protein